MPDSSSPPPPAGLGLQRLVGWLGCAAGFVGILRALYHASQAETHLMPRDFYLTGMGFLVYAIMATVVSVRLRLWRIRTRVSSAILARRAARGPQKTRLQK